MITLNVSCQSLYATALVKGNQTTLGLRISSAGCCGLSLWKREELKFVVVFKKLDRASAGGGRGKSRGKLQTGVSVYKCTQKAQGVSRRPELGVYPDPLIKELVIYQIVKYTGVHYIMTLLNVGLSVWLLPCCATYL